MAGRTLTFGMDDDELLPRGPSSTSPLTNTRSPAPETG
jgi:hypothetical protein